MEYSTLMHHNREQNLNDYEKYIYYRVVKHSKFVLRTGNGAGNKIQNYIIAEISTCS